MGRFLQGIETSPAVVADTFIGFRIDAFAPAWLDAAESAPLAAGDVVERINDKPIAHPDQALAVFESLRDATELVVALRRNGVPQELRFSITDGP